MNFNFLKRKSIIGIMAVFVFLLAAIASAQDIESLLRQIQELQTKLRQLQSQLGQPQEQIPFYAGVPENFVFNKNLRFRNSAGDVRYLQIILNSDSETKIAESGAGSPSRETDYFGPLTRAAIIRFQEKYASEILAPLGLTKGTGLVGPLTRDKLNKLLSEKKEAKPPTPTSTSTPTPVACPIPPVCSGLSSVVFGNPPMLPSGCINYACSQMPIPCPTPPFCPPPLILRMPEPRPGLPVDYCTGGLAECVLPESSPTVTPTPTPFIISDVSATNITQASVTITWTTNKPTGRNNVLYSLNPSILNRGSSASDVISTYKFISETTHQVALDAFLIPGTTYYYVVGSGDSRTNLTYSSERSFTTLALPPSPFSGPDLDVLYIERTPRYYRYCVQYPYSIPDIPSLCPGTENNKRWPDIGETVTYSAHIMNKGGVSSSGFGYQWLVNGVVAASGELPSLGPRQKTAVSHLRSWSSSGENIQFKIDPGNVIPEFTKANNSLTIGSRDLTISIWVEQGLYDIFNNTSNLAGTYSFEDWIQTQFKQMNERFSQARYPVALNGILDRVRIDKIVVAENLDGPSSPLNSDPHLYLIDGRWGFMDGDSSNSAGRGGKWQDYVNEFANKIDWGLIHELSHQIGIIDDYRMNLSNDPQNNMRVQVRDINGNIITASKLPTYAWHQILFQYPGIMAGGSTLPYKDGSYYTNHNAAGMNTNHGHRRGYYGEYLFDTPADNYLKVLDVADNPIAGAEVRLFQKHPYTEYIDNTPEISGTTNEQGIIYLPNRPVIGVTTATGHTLRSNPFGQIHHWGSNGTMLVQVFKDGKEGYGWLFIIDLNLAYWSGNKDSATYTVKTDFPK